MNCCESHGRKIPVLRRHGFFMEILVSLCNTGFMRVHAKRVGVCSPRSISLLLTAPRPAGKRMTLAGATFQH